MIHSRKFFLLLSVCSTFIFGIRLSAQTAVSIGILTGGGDWYEDTVRIYATVSDASIGSAMVEVRGNNYVHDTTVSVSSSLLSALVPLVDGRDTIIISITKPSAATVSSRVVFDYHADHSTNIIINYNISGSAVILDATSSTNPDNLPVSYLWEPDPLNPSLVALSGSNTATVSYESPTADGEYYFTVKAITSLDTSWARAVIVVDSGRAHIVDSGTWHPSWIDNAVIYEIFVNSFSFGGQFIEVTAAIPQLKALGINCIWLMPIYPAVSTHGYNVTDYYHVRSSYGSNSDFANLVNTAHQYGIKVILDLVINHTSAEHPFIKDAYQYGIYSPYNDFYVWHNGVVSESMYVYYYGWSDLANINYQSNWTKEYLLRMSKYWIEKFNIDGYRCDVAWGVNDGGVNEWGQNEIRPGGPAFWQTFRAELKSVKPDIYLLGEMDAARYYGRSPYFDKKFDSGYDWSFLSSIENCLTHISSVTTFDLLVKFYESSNYPSFARPFRFIENHDLSRFISMYNVQQTKMAATLLLTMPGVPLIYSGQEYGELTMRNLIDRTDPNDLNPFYTKLIHIRTSHPSLEQGSLMRLQTSSNDTVYAYLRMFGNDKVVVLNNFYSNNVNTIVTIPRDSLRFDSTKTWYVNDILNGESTTVNTSSSLDVFDIDLAPFQSRILIFSNSPIYNGVMENEAKPKVFKLDQNFPNPFNPSTHINYSLAQSGFVSLKVYNTLGENVQTLVSDYKHLGDYSLTFNGNRLSSGIYFLRLQQGSLTSTKKLLLLK
ncbi:MAG: alpha-amylase family glycosyl hydrolase [Ignavibacteriales bacterium]|nr:alpha-amylase family glycosyl hydrolase [Ignavibacteriales bacterium]